MGLWSNRTTPAWRAGNAGSTPAGSTPYRRVAGYGLPGRLAKPCGRKAVRPSHRIGACWYYSKDEVLRIRDQLRRSKKPEGMFTVREAAKLLGVSDESVSLYIRRHPHVGLRPVRFRVYLSRQDVETM